MDLLRADDYRISESFRQSMHVKFAGGYNTKLIVEDPFNALRDVRRASKNNSISYARAFHHQHQSEIYKKQKNMWTHVQPTQADYTAPLPADRS
eukprot:2060163-Karenia_brevis.AAC.1